MVRSVPGWLALALALVVVLVVAAASWHRARAPQWTEAELEPLVRETEVLSGVFVVDDYYPSMKGPKTHVRGSLLDVDPPELLWVVGYRAQMVDAGGEAALPQEFMCHANLNLDAQAHRERFGARKAANPRLFTLSQGQHEVRFPAGFGIPVASDEALDLGMQVLNLNREVALEGPLEVQHRVTIRWVRDADLPRPLRPLFMEAASGLVSLSGGPAWYNTESPDPEAHGEGCAVGRDAVAERYETGGKKDRLGKRFSGHWVVPPGRQVLHTNVTRYMNLPFDTRVHYVAVHLHPFAESLSLRDLDTGETLFTSRAHNFSDRIGLQRVEEYASTEGFALEADHEYELVSVYDNSSGRDQDAMAVMFMYAEDHEFVRPAGL